MIAVLHKGERNMDQKKKAGLGIASLILGIIGTAFAFIPIINNAAFVLGIIGLILGIIGLIKKNKKGITITGLILCILAMVITLALQASYKKTLDTAQNKLSDASGENTEEILGKDVTVDLGAFTVSEEQYGMTKTSLPVTVANLTNESKSFSIQLEADASDGSRIKDDYVYANDLGAGQKQEFDAFAYVSSDQLEAVKAATFKIVKVSMH
jgi:hypothetical protein